MSHTRPHISPSAQLKKRKEKRMSSGSEENLGFQREKAMEELLRGRDCADRLRIAMDDPSISKEDLLRKIVASFTNTLSIIGRFDDVSLLPVGSPPHDSRRSDDSGESIRSSLPRNRRGCYKRRKHENSWSREDSPLPYEDAHSWRKYGQKNILRSNHPRNYFRCTHKYDQKCQATKQVQKVQEDPPVFRTTYYGHHTCRNLLDAPHHLFLHDHDGASLFLSFNENSSFTLPVKQEDKAAEADRKKVPEETVVVVQQQEDSSSSALDDMVDSFGFDDYMDGFTFDFSG